MQYKICIDTSQCFSEWFSFPAKKVQVKKIALNYGQTRSKVLYSAICFEVKPPQISLFLSVAANRNWKAFYNDVC